MSPGRGRASAGGADCCRRHPLTRARLIPSPQGETSYQWDIADEVDLDPLRVVECSDSAALDRLRTELYTPAIPLDTTPGLPCGLLDTVTRHPSPVAWSLCMCRVRRQNCAP